MMLLPITARATGLGLAATAHPPEGAIARALAALPPGSPVVIMVHGMGYCPLDPSRDPHSLLFAPRPSQGLSRTLSWPRRLGFALPAPRAARGLGLGFGWSATGSLWTATAAADRVAPMLARLIQMIRRADPARRIDLIGHSLGARVILGAVPHLGAGVLGRVILLAGADLTDHAAEALDTPAGRTAEFLNITTRENDLFDALFERALSPFGGAAALGRGLNLRQNWLDIQIDHPATAAALADLGLPLAPPRARICHRSVYLRPGTFRLYRALIHDRARLPLPLLRAALDHAPHPRWTRLLRPALHLA